MERTDVSDLQLLTPWHQDEIVSGVRGLWSLCVLPCVLDTLGTYKDKH